MIITDNHIFVHIPKTGGKSVTEFINQNKKCLSTREDNYIIKIREPEEGTLDAPHVPLNFCSHIPIRWINRYDMEHTYKVKFCTIRNPWDWYISYYFYADIANKNFWQQKIDQQFVGNFNQWVQKLLNNEYLDVEYSHSEYENYPLLRRFKHMKKLNIGLYTQMFLDYCLVLSLDTISIDDLNIELINSRLGVNNVCKLENLKHDLLSIFRKSKIELHNKDIPHVQKTNRPYPFNYLKSRYDFYEEETKNLIYEKDKLFVEKYGYQF